MTAEPEPIPLYRLLDDWLKDAGWSILRIIPASPNEAVIAYTDEEAERRWHERRGEARYSALHDVARIMSDHVVVYDIRLINKPNTNDKGVVLMASDPDFLFKLDEALKTVCFKKSAWFQGKDGWSGKRESWEV